HVVLERSEVANSWRTERWDSLRLLTPNWQCRLPGREYNGDDPDGFMTMPEVVDFIAGYAKEIAAPVQTGTAVTSVSRNGEGSTDVPRSRHPLVDGGGGGTRRALRRGRRHRSGPAGAVDANCGHARTIDLRLERAHRRGGGAGRPARRHPRRARPVLRIAAQQ